MAGEVSFESAILISPVEEVEVNSEHRKSLSKVTYISKSLFNYQFQTYLDKSFPQKSISIQTILGLGAYLKSLSADDISKLRRPVTPIHSREDVKSNDFEDEKMYRKSLKILLDKLVVEKDNNSDYSLVSDKHSVQVFKKEVSDKKILCFRAHIKIDRPLHLVMYYISEVTK